MTTVESPSRTPRRSTRFSTNPETTPSRSQTPIRSTRSSTNPETTPSRPQTPIRGTRSSTKPETTPSRHPPPRRTPNDLVISVDQDRPTLDALVSQFPGRRSQIQDLICLLGPTGSPTLPLFLYGAPATGKTSVLLRTLDHLGRPVVYCSCRTSYTPRILFESALSQLSLHRRDSSNGYSSSRRCDKPSDFANLLREALEKKDRPPEMVYLVFDNLELVRGWDKGSVVLPFLLDLYEVLKMPDRVGVVFVSSVPPDTYYCSNATGFVDPVPVYFPEYDVDNLRRILTGRHYANPKLYSCFLDVVLRPFCRVTRRVDELSTAFKYLFRKYCEPLGDISGVLPNDEIKRKLYSRFQPHIASALNETFRIQSWPSLDDGSNEEASRGGSGRKSEVHKDFTEVDFHMSTSAKYLLISAFLASRNPATLDASLFDSTGGSDARKRKRKASEKSLDKKEAAEQELLMKGPGTFPLERLLAIFQCISVEETSTEEEKHDNHALGAEEGESGLMCDVLLQLSSLCDANFIIRGGSCPLEGAARYRSTVSEDLALKVARSLKFPLPNYLYRR